FLPLRQVGVHYHDAADGVAAADEALTMIERDEPAIPGRPIPDLGPVRAVRLTAATTDRTEPLTALARAGDLTVLTGPSGAGKTTALQLIMGWLTPCGGTVELSVDGTWRPLGADVVASWRRQLAWVP